MKKMKLLDVCNAERAHPRPILICALDTAMHGGEIFKIRWRDVNLFTGEIFIPQTNTKTERSRIVGITPRLREELEHLQRVSSGNPNGLVFGISNTVKRSWKTDCNLAGVEDFDCMIAVTQRRPE
jgi:integrase